MYSGKIILTNKANLPFVVSNDFDDEYELKEDIMECQTASEALKTAQEHIKYSYKISIAKDISPYTRLSYADGWGNVRYLILYKEAR